MTSARERRASSKAAMNLGPVVDHEELLLQLSLDLDKTAYLPISRCAVRTEGSPRRGSI